MIRCGVRPLLCAAAAALVQGAALAQAPGAGLLVAKPQLVDPNFQETVVLVAGTPDGAAVGVIINRPTRQALADILPGNPALARFTEPLFFGGPVAVGGLFAVFRAAEPAGAAVRVAEDLWIALDPATIERLMRTPPAEIRFFIGYSGWAPGQLQAELARGAWWTLPVDAKLAFRPDPSSLWEELANRARAVTASR
ncbi:MAG: YqgE/AlgH family protein [Burkholderiales bacterium]|nr:YqgE/AlgH family protein [Burkholderiales bacterium]